MLKKLANIKQDGTNAILDEIEFTDVLLDE